jgi:hypothetical protein
MESIRDLSQWPVIRPEGSGPVCVERRSYVEGLCNLEVCNLWPEVAKKSIAQGLYVFSEVFDLKPTSGYSGSRVLEYWSIGVLELALGCS